MPQLPKYLANVLNRGKVNKKHPVVLVVARRNTPAYETVALVSGLRRESMQTKLVTHFAFKLIPLSADLNVVPDIHTWKYPAEGVYENGGHKVRVVEITEPSQLDQKLAAAKAWYQKQLR